MPRRKSEKAQPVKMGAPEFEWTPEVEGEILSRIMGGESVVKICGNERDDWIPSERTFYRHLISDHDFWQRYAHAREAQGHREADEALEIADSATVEDVQVARLRVDTRKWRAGKLAPKSYGDKATFEHTGKDGGPMVVEVVIGGDGED